MALPYANFLFEQFFLDKLLLETCSLCANRFWSISLQIGACQSYNPNEIMPISYRGKRLDILNRKGDG